MSFEGCAVHNYLQQPGTEAGHSSNDEAFDASPIPAKRRRLNRAVLDSSDVEPERPIKVNSVTSTSKPAARQRTKKLTQQDDVSPAQTKARERKPRGRPRKLSPDPNLVRVRKHRIIVNEGKPSLEDSFCTQAPPSSCPWRVRGPIWQKPSELQAPAPSVQWNHGMEQVSSSQTDLGAKSPTTIKVTGVGRISETLRIPMLRETLEDHDDSEDDAFEPLVKEQRPGGTSIAGSETPDGPSNTTSSQQSSSDEEQEISWPIGETDNVLTSLIQEGCSHRSLTPAVVASRSIQHQDPLAVRASASTKICANSESKRCDDTNLQPPRPQEVTSSWSALTTSELLVHRSSTNEVNRHDFAKELEDLPSDAFASSSSSPTRSPQRLACNPSTGLAQGAYMNTRLAAPSKGLRQMTLFGDATQHMTAASQAEKVHNWPVSKRNEPPTHHKLDEEALKTWVYPTNLGTIRDYQYNIVLRGLYHNLLVALPTGLGKTFIAATIMLNWYRWTKDAQIVFVAPTKPLVSQQVQACFAIAGIPRSQTSMLTGGISPGLRAEEWTSKRVFFMTPQTIVNDLKTGICDPKRIVLLVVDEAHRATGAYAYVEVVNLIRRFNPSFRVLGLTATPGSSVETVQQVIDGLNISRVEIRTEFSLDIRQYVHSRDILTIPFDPSDEMDFIASMFSDAVRPVLMQLVQHNGYWSKDPMGITVYGLRQQQQKWNASEPGRKAHVGIKVKVNKIFSVLIRLASSVELLKFHGVRPFYKGMKKFQKECEESPGSVKYEREILDSIQFNNMMGTLDRWHKREGFMGHPKLDHLQDVILRHFTDANEVREMAPDRPASRIMVFVQYRSSAEVISELLQTQAPLVRPHLFVGQAASKDSEGMDQAKQLEVINRFKDGTYNVLVATSIGEEGLDIGEIDLIVCYDSSASPVRMLQRMGRTGRKRAGNIIVLLMKGKEENNFAQSKDNYEKMQQKISARSEFKFHDDRSTRIVPKDIQPVVDKRIVEIPQENTQAGLPEPKKKNAKAPKRPPKKFHMPDGVRTGFVSASRLDSDEDDDSISGTPNQQKRRGQRMRDLATELEPIPALDDVVLTVADERELNRRFQNVSDMSEAAISELDLGLHPRHQHALTGTKYVKHARRTKETVRVLNAIYNTDLSTVEQFRRTVAEVDVEALCRSVATVPSTISAPLRNGRHVEPRPTKLKQQAGKQAPGKMSRKESLPQIDSEPIEAQPSSAPPTSPRMRLVTQGESLGSSDTEGEDDVELPDSDLADFVVDNDAEDDSPNDGNESDDDDSDDLDVCYPLGKKAPKVSTKSVANLFTSHDSATWQSSGEDLPSMMDLIEGNRTGIRSQQKDHAASREPVMTARRSRRVVLDTSSDA